MSRWHRRRVLAAGLGWALGQATVRRASALLREPYGGRLRLTLPIETERIDPHDVEDWGAALLGPNLFESLYALDARGQPYPTLAAELPEERGGRTWVRLRPELRSARDRPLDAGGVLAALGRAERAQPWLTPLGSRRREGSDALSFVGISALELARRLASPDYALVTPDFEPSRPDGHCAFTLARGEAGFDLVRNVRAARGGSFLDAVRIEGGELSDCLRAFESGRSELGWLGDGLYQKRPGARPFRLAPLGLVYLVPGRALGRLAAPGVLAAALEATPSRALDALGYQRSVQSTGRTASWPTGTLLYPRGSAQLRATAEALAEAWSRPQARLEPRGEPRRELDERRRRGDFELLLGFARTSHLDERALHALVTTLDGTPIPARFVPERPERLTRRLSLGIVGRLVPSGACTPALERALRGTAIELADQRWRPA